MVPRRAILPLSGLPDLDENDRPGGSGGLPLLGPLDRDGNHARLAAELYADLRARAERFMRGQPADQSLQTTALVHEACLKIFGQDRLASTDRSHFLALGSAAMRSVLVDHARARARAKRAPPGERVPLDQIADAFEERAGNLLALDEGLNKLAGFDPEMARAVELHFFGGLSLADTAAALGLSQRTLERRWATTRAWLRAEIG